MAQFRTVLFDLDGTLIDTGPLIIACFQHALRQGLGVEVQPEQLIPHFGEPLPVTMARFAPPERVPELVALYRQHQDRLHDRLTRPIPGVAEMLAALQQAGIRLGVTTSKMTERARRGLRLFGLEGYFAAVVGWDGTGRHKPDPDPVWRTLDLLGERPGPQVLLVGDSTFDLEAGRRAGVRTAAVGWSALPRDVLAAAQPDFWVETPGDVVRLCLGPAAPTAPPGL